MKRQVRIDLQAWLVASACLVPQAVLAEAAISSESLEAAGTVIGTVTVTSNSIFDLQDPREDKSLYRFLNRAHITTRPEIISEQLLFESGGIFSTQALEESERLLRANRFIQDAEIVPVNEHDGVVDINVTTSDVWSLMPKLSYSRSGGESKTEIGLSELNLFGSGIQVEALYSSDVDRNSTLLKIVDKHIGDSWYGIKTIYENSDDGQQLLVDFGKPFHSLDSRSARGVLFDDYDRIDSLYDRGEKTAEYRHHSRNYELRHGWSEGLHNGWARRYVIGLAYDQHLFSSVEGSTESIDIMPADREFLYPFIAYELVQDRFVEAENMDQISRTEDLYLGTSAFARLGFAAEGAGSDRDAWLLSAGARTSFGDVRESLLSLSSELATRVETAGIQNLTLALDARYYRRQSEKRIFFAHVNGTYGENLDLDQQLYLGGDSGLRGYPLRYQTGDKRALLTLEQRFFTDWYPFRLVRVGAAVFFDAGRTWGDSAFGTGNDGLLTDVGVGLRLGNSRSGLGRMTHIDVAYPLDGSSDISNVQFLVSLKQSF